LGGVGRRRWSSILGAVLFLLTPISTLFQIGAVLRFTMNYNLTPVAIITAIILFIIGWSSIMDEYYWNKGPDDFGSDFYADKVLAQKYGPFKHKVKIHDISFTKGDSGAGDYSMNYEWDGIKGSLIFHYNPVTKTFSDPHINEGKEVEVDNDSK
jgi:hypothetical protein